MSVMGPFFLLIAAVSIFWLWREGVLEAPWLQEGEIPAYRGGSRPPAAAKAGLIVFLAVALCLFSLMCAAFFMRMEAADWQLPTPPRILWLNTLVLIASSVALQIAQSAAKAQNTARMREAFTLGVLTSSMFLLGQFWAWREMTANGFTASQNPANAFFYLLTGAHGLHLLGGLVALASVSQPAWRCKENTAALAAPLGLCALYWHFLLGVWLLIFILLSGWANSAGIICRRLLS